jgi:Ca2+-binding EF-hand superfamily protein
MTFRTTSISMIAALAVTGGTALAQSGGNQSFCEAGYVAVDGDSDGMVNQDELAKATELEFSDLDANGDGMISQDEYMDCRTGWLPDPATEEALSEEDVTVLDQNKDGEVDQGEYMEAADQQYMARWSETGTGKEVRDADFAPATPKGEGGVGGDAQTDAASNPEGGNPSDMEAAASKSAESGIQNKTENNVQDAASGNSAEGYKATGNQGEGGQPQGLFLRRIIFVPAGDARGPGDMSHDEIAKRSAQKFLLLDTDGNKVIAPEDSAEAKAANAIVNQTINQQFNRADADRSGDISREEYAADAQARWEEARSRAESQNAQSDAGAPVVYFHYPHPM